MFNPYQYKDRLLALLEAFVAETELTQQRFFQLVKQYPRPNGRIFSKSQLIHAYRVFVRDGVMQEPDLNLVERIRRKPTRTLSGVTPVTALTKPYPCPGGQCIFCPTDVRMPKSYLRDEPGAQRAEAHRFDPYAQTFARLTAYWRLGHPTDKAEMIILGGTWSAYPVDYQRWFIKRIFDALNDFGAGENTRGPIPYLPETPTTWADVLDAHHRNESARCRCVGLVVETRPDYVTPEEITRLRRLGCTKVQLGIQSLDDAVLEKNRRGHDVAATRRAIRLLRGAGFKIQAHWMANLYGSNPQQDIEDFARLFDDPDIRPDELKIYPCSLIEGTPLMDRYEQGLWHPYTDQELRDVLMACLAKVPLYCRVTRLMRDIPAPYIVDGTTTSNFREVVEHALEERGIVINEIRSREVRGAAIDFDTLRLDEIPYQTATGEEVFLQFVTPANQIAGFLRLSLPSMPGFIAELGEDAVIREVHVYGKAVDIGTGEDDRTQHSGLGTRMVRRAQAIARTNGYQRLQVISAIGTRGYYRKLGFQDSELYQWIAL